MQLYNTLTKKIENFRPLTAQTARIYSCGPTVYDHAHIGNLSAFIFADTLRRAIVRAGFKAKHVMNYTDVNDKIIARSQQEYPNDDPNSAMLKLADHYIEVFLDDMLKIGNDANTIIFIRATDAIDDMKQLITDLHQKGFAYISDDGVYFSIEAYKKSGKNYGQLTEITAQNTSAARIQNDEYDKNSVHDFALWKKQKPGEPSWEFTIAGHNLAGRPGWHIECSVMSRLLLGQPFDIHTGGIDLIFPHHENEIAQSTALESGPLMARFFCHNEHLLVDGQKMAKSKNNFYTLDDITKQGYDPLAFRLLVLQAHYRKQAHFSVANLAAAQNRLQNYRAMADLRFQIRLDGTYEGPDYAEYQKIIEQAMQRDLDTPAALAALSGAEANSAEPIVDIAGTAKEFTNFLQAVDDLLGLNLLESSDITAEQKTLIKEREAARAAQNWSASDQLRDKLAGQNIGLRDTSLGTVWFRK